MWDQIPGWSSFLWMYDRMVDEAKDGDTIVEVGVAFGRSVAYLARKVIDSGKRVRVVAVDPWLDDRWEFPNSYPIDAPRPGWGGEHAEMARARGGPFCAFLSLMHEHSREELERITVLRCKSSDAARVIGPCRGVMIDASHDYVDVTADIAIWRPHIIPGGVLAGDDYCTKDFPGVVQAVREAFPDTVGDRAHASKGTTWWARPNGGGQ
jgi:cephalosporin hydroxylase